jgi:hypothetical protein
MSLEEALGLAQTTKETQNQEKELLTPKQYAITHRRSQLTAYLLKGNTLAEFAKEQSISEDTAQDDFATLVRDGLGISLVEEWMGEYAKMKKANRLIAFKSLTDLIKKVLEKEAKIAVNVQNTTNVSVNLTEQIKTLIDISEQ